MYFTSEVCVPFKIYILFIKGIIQADWVKSVFFIKLNISIYNICIGGYDPLI